MLLTLLLSAGGCVAVDGPGMERGEAVLRTNLAALRDAIEQYEGDTVDCLRDLDRLVVEGYFRRLPIDPFAPEGSTWLPIRDDAGCVRQVRSTSTATAIDGSPYRDW